MPERRPSAQRSSPRTPRTPLPPLDNAALDRLALRYVERFATSRGRLADYLRRKIRERGWDGAPVDPGEVAQRMADAGYVDDRSFADARATGMARRGLGARRVAQVFHRDGIADEDADALAPDIADRALDAALALARRRRIGPFAITAPDRPTRERQLAQMLRGGHALALARRIVDTAPGAELGDLD